MKLQPITWKVDAMASQSRVILWLACGHKMSYSVLDMQASPSLSRALHESKSWGCTFCPDPVPEDLRQSKSAPQLWREAGEP